MSKIDELIEKLCPNGVEFKTINDVCNKILSGGTPKTTNKDYYSGNIPWLRSGEINFNEITDTEIKITEKGLNASSAKWIKPKSVLIALTGATVARSAVNEIAITANQSVCAMEVSEIINYKYLYYTIANMYHEIKKKAQGILTSINLSIIKSIKIPVPPLEIQCEIVRILDKFSSCSTELIALLKAELKARKQQYEYYSTKLFEQTQGEVISISQLANYGKTLYFDSDIQSVYASFLIKIVPDNTKLLNKYYWHFTKTPLYWKQAKQLVTRGAQPQFNAPALKQIKIPVPTLEEQQRIIDILDKLFYLTNDLTAGIPAEIEARQKQYEYYRDKLLTFKELNKE